MRRSNRSALSGALAQVSVATVLTIFEMEGRSGMISVRGGGQRAQIAVRSGQVIRASVLTDRQLHGREAIYALLEWRDGIFEFLPCPIDGADEVNLSTTHLLLEAAKRADELAA